MIALDFRIRSAGRLFRFLSSQVGMANHFKDSMWLIHADHLLLSKAFLLYNYSSRCIGIRNKNPALFHVRFQEQLWTSAVK
jgi:hypothetical protein